MVPTNGAQHSCSWPSMHAPLPHPPLATAHATDPPPRHVFHHSCAGASSPSLVGRTHVKERERDTEWDSWESAAALLEWPFLVATSFSTSFFSWPANVAARGRTESAHRERRVRKKVSKKAHEKSFVKSSSQLNRFPCACLLLLFRLLLLLLQLLLLIRLQFVAVLTVLAVSKQ